MKSYIAALIDFFIVGNLFFSINSLTSRGHFDYRGFIAYISAFSACVANKCAGDVETAQRAFSHYKHS